MKKKEDEKGGLFRNIINFFKSISRTIRTNPAISKTIVWTLSLLILTVSIGGGLIHKNRVETKRALTLSDIDQKISFSKTGTEVHLAKQKRYKNMTVVPIKFDSGDKQSLNAKDYLVGIEARKGDSLSPNVTASLASFSSNGNMSLVLKGDLPKKPIQILLRNDNNFTKSDEGTGTYMDWGKEQKTKQNVVAFTVNPKGNNISIDKRINSDMKMKDLYALSFGEEQIKILDKEKNKTNNKIESLRSNRDEIKRQIKQLNKALDRKESDFELSRPDNDDDNNTNYDSKLDDDDYNSLENTDLSSTDMESLRNKKINKYDSIVDDIDQEKDNLNAINNKVKQVKDNTDKMSELTTISNRFQIID